jgi:hypothetical protein
LYECGSKKFIYGKKYMPIKISDFMILDRPLLAFLASFLPVRSVISPLETHPFSLLPSA